MNLYNYDYSDMMEINFGCDTREKITMTSKVYPTNLEIKIDKETNRPYMYYEGIVQTNKGAMKVTIPRLDLVLDCMSVETTAEDEREFLGFKIRNKINNYKMTTSFNNIGEVGDIVTLYTSLHCREDEMSLFGFLDKIEREVFKKLILGDSIRPFIF